MKFVKILFLLAVAIVLSSCSKDEEPFDHPFIYIADAQGGSSAVIDCDGTFFQIVTC